MHAVGEFHPTVASSLNNIGVLLCKKDRYSIRGHELGQSLFIAERVGGDLFLFVFFSSFFAKVTASSATVSVTHAS